MFGKHFMSAGAGAPAGSEAAQAVKDIPPDLDAEPLGASDGNDSMSEEEEVGCQVQPFRAYAAVSQRALPYPYAQLVDFSACTQPRLSMLANG